MFFIILVRHGFYFIISGESRKIVLVSEFTKGKIVSTTGIKKTFLGGGEEYQNREGEEKIFFSNLI